MDSGGCRSERGLYGTSWWMEPDKSRGARGCVGGGGELTCGRTLPRQGPDLSSMMQPITTSLLLLLAASFPVLKAKDPVDTTDHFFYDWHRLRVGGLIFAGILCTLGIVVVLSGKCKCKFNRKARQR
ncbi:FXYD domain-containing ion transport regulator 3-like isoform X2 [Pelodiscus sinensis]|uniref:FXYD domain-containing ion transport regulator 3-like isoform X2 n=1 Tax=Pelodiscus sinensis TaxID=13735 RepID=UPI003F6AE417